MGGGIGAVSVQLVKYEAACHALAAAKAIDEVKDIHDKAEAMRAYGKQAKNRDLEVDAAEIRMRAERRLGQMLIVSPKNTGSRGIGKSGVPPKHPTFQDAGIDKKLSSRAQKLAAVPEADFEGMVGKWRDRVGKENERVTTNLLRAGEQERRDRDLCETEWPTGKYAVIYADPPWRYEHPPIGASNRSIENQYPTMTLEDICALPVETLLNDNAILFLWATAPKLAECLQVIEAWGFVYRTCMVWVKDKIGMGYHARNKHEILLIAKRGQLAPPEPVNRPASVVESPRQKHSAKPAEFYDLIERMYPALPKIELFSRSPREGWTAWGNEAYVSS